MASIQNRTDQIAVVAVVMLLLMGATSQGQDPANAPRLAGQWRRDSETQQRFVIQGAGDRNNPIRRALAKPYRGEQLFVRYRMRYQASSIDLPAAGDGEFFVMWLDEAEGGPGSTHVGGVPNIGVHVSGGANRFMVRYEPSSQRFGKPLVGDKDLLVVARLWKSTPGREQPFDQLSVWIDPKPGDEEKPDASTSNAKAIPAVAWIGFSTGRKTEVDDRIQVWDIEVAERWRAILDLPPQQESQPPSTPVRPTIDFAAHVLPILKRRCFRCHAGAEPSSEVRLDVWDEVLNHTSPRNAEQSRLIQLVAEKEMPPEGEHATAAELQVLRDWIDEGLRWDEELLPAPKPTTTHWSFQPIKRPAIPSVENKAWVRTPVDAFVAARHEQVGLRPAPEAPPRTLARRMALDLTGLPPADPAKATLDALLQSPDYGERWARHWLDVARWAESNGHQHNRRRRHAWRYRDWVIEAFNQNKPFNEFLREQIAGDQLAPADASKVIATGFLAAARYSGNELDKDIQRNDILVDIANTTSQAFLGLTLECAQCHTHKFDPLSIRDYYQFQAFFADGQPGNVVLASDGETSKRIEERWRLFDTVHARLRQIKRRQGVAEPVITPTAVMAGMKANEKARLNQLDKQIGAAAQAWSFYSPQHTAKPLAVAPHNMRFPLPRPTAETPHAIRLLIRGDVKSPGPEVRPGWPAVFDGDAEPDLPPRTALANWMSDANRNPLTARVWANRVWQWHFGDGLVESASDFGHRGALPTHPSLLEFLAAELIDSGWDTQHLHRLIVNSATYRQAAAYSESNAKIDPQNKLLWRWRPRRLESEAIRDLMLAVSGQLDRTRGGPSADLNAPRRTVYLRFERQRVAHNQLLFDAPLADVGCERRRVTTTVIQPLWLLNSDFVYRAATKLAQRAGSAENAFMLAIGRPPNAEEEQALRKLDDEHGLVSVCLAILNYTEFIYIA